MKRWSGQVFPLFLLAFLAGLSFWLARVADLPNPKRDGKLRHDPDTVAENFTVRRLNSQGSLQYRLFSPYMQHFGDDDSSLVANPRFVYYRPGAPDTTLEGQHALVTERGDKVYVWNDVVVTRMATPEHPELIARMPDITIRPDDGLAFTDKAVEVTQGPSWMRGVGMDIDNNLSTFVIRSRATGLLYRTKQQP